MAVTSRITPPNLRRNRTFHAFHNPSYRLLWLANFFSYISRWMQMTLLLQLVLNLTDSPWLVALVGFFGMAPMLVLGVFGGVLADRLDRHKLLVATQALKFAAVLAMALLLQRDVVVYWHAYLVIGVSGVGWALDMPARRSVLHDLFGGAGVTNAVALDSVGMHSSKMLGPALAGALILMVGVSGGYVVVTAFYAIALALMWLVRLPANEASTPTAVEASSGATASNVSVGTAPQRSRQTVLSNLVEGFRYVRGNDTIMAIVLITVLMNLLLFPYMQMVPVIARDVLGVGPGLMGVLMAADGLGALIGAVLIASAANITHHGRIYVGGSMLALLAMLLFSFSRWYFVSLPVLFVLGLGVAGFGTMQGTIVMLVARHDMRGRALGVISLAIGAGPLGALMVGAIANAVSPTFAIGLNAVLGFVALAAVALLMPSLRRRIAPERDLVPEPRRVPQRVT